MRKEIIGNATLYLGDCMEGMQEMSDKAFDLAIVDPPYGIGFDGENPTMVLNKSDKWKNKQLRGYTKKDWDKAIPPPEYFSELMRVCKNQIIWGGNYFSLPPSGGWVVWEKQRPADFSLSQAELAWVANSGRVAIFSYLWNGFQKQIPEPRFHPTQKPVRLYSWLLQNYAKPGQTILDTHLGSGSSVIACLDRGHSVTAYEIDEEYFNLACLRIEQSLQQLKLAL